MGSILKAIWRPIYWLIKKFYSFLFSYQGGVFILKTTLSILAAFAITYWCYKSTNDPTNDSKVNAYVNEMQKFLTYRSNEEIDNLDWLKNVVCVNIGNDKELTDSYDLAGLKVGQQTITNRGKIAEFLKLTQNKYKFLVLDLLLFPNNKSKNDSCFKEQIIKSERLILPSFMDGDSIINPKNLSHTGFSGFNTTPENFRILKYGFYVQDSIKSMPLRMLELLNNQFIEKGRFLDSSSGKLALSSIILNQRITSINKYNKDGTQNYYELGHDLLDPLFKDYIGDLVKDKIVLIGDFSKLDQHHTSTGILPGVIINYNAYLALTNGDHIFPKSLVLFLLLSFWCFFMAIVFRTQLSSIIGFRSTLKKNQDMGKSNVTKIIDHPLSKFILDIILVFVSTFSVLILWSAIVYSIFKIHLDIANIEIPLIIVVLLLSLVSYFTSSKTSNK